MTDRPCNTASSEVHGASVSFAGDFRGRTESFSRIMRSTFFLIGARAIFHGLDRFSSSWRVDSVRSAFLKKTENNRSFESGAGMCSHLWDGVRCGVYETPFGVWIAVVCRKVSPSVPFSHPVEADPSDPLLHSLIGLSFSTTYAEIFITQGLGSGVRPPFLPPPASPRHLPPLTTVLEPQLAAGIIFLPAVSSISHYFSKRRAFAVGILMTGSAIGGIIWPVLLNKLFNEVGFRKGVQACGFIL